MPIWVVGWMVQLWQFTITPIDLKNDMPSGAFLWHFTEYALLSGSGGTPSVLGQGWSPEAENGFRAFQKAKQSPQDTQLNTISCIFLPKIKFIQ